MGVPKPVLRAFSRRRAEIEAALEERGTSGPRAAEAAALATRQAKRADVGGRRPGGGMARARSRARLRKRGDLERLLGPSRDGGARRRGMGADVRWARILDWLDVAGVDVLAARCHPGAVRAGPGRRARRRAIARSSGRSFPRLAPRGRRCCRHGGAARRSAAATGGYCPSQASELVYSTPELLALEQRLIDQAVTSRGADAGVTSSAAVAEAVAARPTLSGEQQAMVERLCLDGDGVSVVVGKAGTGKTFALGAAREAWQAAGLPVLGVAVARRAARELEQDAGIASTSVAALLGAIHNHRPTALPERCVLVVDEAGMLPTRQLAELVDAIGRGRAASSCWSATTASCPSSRRAAPSAASSTAASRSS